MGYRPIKQNHDRDQLRGRDLAPHWLSVGKEVVVKGQNKKDLEAYASDLQKTNGAMQRPFRFTTYFVEEDFK